MKIEIDLERITSSRRNVAPVPGHRLWENVVGYAETFFLGSPLKLGSATATAAGRGTPYNEESLPADALELSLDGTYW